MILLAAGWPYWVWGLVLAVVAMLLSHTAAAMLRNVSLPRERLVAAWAAVLLAVVCIGLAVYSFLR